MRVGFAQFSPVFGKKEKNFKKVAALLKGCSADIIVLPELFNTGYTFLNKKELNLLAETLDSETAQFIAGLARQLRCAIAYGFAEKEGKKYYNSMALIAPHGIIGIYRKSHLFCEEKYLFKPGNTGFKIHTYKNVKIGLLICFDWIYPEAMRTLAIKGAQIILHPSNLVLPYCPDAMITRALENCVYAITANRIGKERRNGRAYRFIGMSQIVSPRGEMLVRAGNQECVKIVRIDPNAALNKKVTPWNDVIEDRRGDLYFK